MDVGNHIDLNPFSVFWVTVMTSEVDLARLKEVGHKMIEKYKNNMDKITTNEVKKYFPKDLLLPKDADIPTLHGLFSSDQMRELGYLKSLILEMKDKKTSKLSPLCFFKYYYKA